ncbi:hypothetical protein BJY52DRAFT_1226408 [Lactarius psammicola]|nr:hypothetical protein BJY52DRAFT_1226408 [Lactarius psammicola]
MTTLDASPTPSAQATTTPHAPPTSLRAKWCAEGQHTPPPPPIAYAGCTTPPPWLTHPRLLPHMPLCAYAVGAGGAGGGARKGGTWNEGQCNPSGEWPGVAPPALCPCMRAKLGGCMGRAGWGTTQRKAAHEQRGVRTRVVLPHIRAKVGGCVSGAGCNPGEGRARNRRGRELSPHPCAQ